MEWRPIPGYEAFYEASNEGQIRRTGEGHGSKVGRILMLTDHKQGYKAVSLNTAGHVRTWLVHRLVALAFIGPLGGGIEVHHRDGDKKNNHVNNLERLQRQANIDHAVADGLINNKGSRNTQARLTAEQVSEIKRRYRRGGNPGYKALGKEFGISWAAIRQIVKGKTWQHII